MESIFGVPWERMDLAEMAAFFADAGDEGLTWEAKGTQRPHPASVRKHVSAFANAIGGFYIVGATRDSRVGPWRVDPVDFEGVEPTTWLGNVIRNGVRPVPRYDIREWAQDGGHVAIVNLDPVAEPPCMTTAGEVFERVSGESIRIADPGLLRALFDRGAAAAAAAETFALRATEPPAARAEPEPPYMRLAIGVAPTGKPESVGSRLFSAGFEADLRDSFQGLPPDPLLLDDGSTRVYSVNFRQDALIARAASQAGPWPNRQLWEIQANWDGSIGVVLNLHPDHPGKEQSLLGNALVESAVRPASVAATRLAGALGAFGRRHVVLRIAARSFILIDQKSGTHGRIPGPNALRPIQVWTSDSGLIDEDVLERMHRELLRASGISAYEPDD